VAWTEGARSVTRNAVLTIVRQICEPVRNADGVLIRPPMPLVNKTLPTIEPSKDR
jgi:hypothetical protein